MRCVLIGFCLFWFLTVAVSVDVRRDEVVCNFKPQIFQISISNLFICLNDEMSFLILLQFHFKVASKAIA